MPVYFIEASGRDLVKIGTSWSPYDRLKQLQTGNPHELRLLGTVDGGEVQEKALHTRFRMYHVRGEWFRLSDEIKAYIADHGPGPHVVCGEASRVIAAWVLLLPPLGFPSWLAVAVWAVTRADWLIIFSLWLGTSVVFAILVVKTSHHSHKALHRRFGTMCLIELEVADRVERMRAWDEERRKTTLPELKSYRAQLEEELLSLEAQIEETAIIEDSRESVIGAFADIPGIGVLTAESLWEAGFTSLIQLEKAGVGALVKVKGIGPTLASKILRTLSRT